MGDWDEGLRNGVSIHGEDVLGGGRPTIRRC